MSNNYDNDFLRFENHIPLEKDIPLDDTNDISEDLKEVIDNKIRLKSNVEEYAPIYGCNVYNALNNSKANYDYKIPSEEYLFNNLDVLYYFLNEQIYHRNKRYNVLKEYYLNHNISILQRNRRLGRNKTDVRSCNPFARKIVTAQTSYTFSKPIVVESPNKNTQEIINDVNKNNGMDNHNKELATDMSIYGRAYEVLYRDSETKKDKFKISSPFNTFLIYSSDLNAKPLFAVRFTKIDIKNNESFIITLHSKNYIYTFKPIAVSDFNEDFFEKATLKRLTDVKRQNLYGGVNIIEYKNNKLALSDFESVIQKIDEYDRLSSDLSNASGDSVDAILTMTGNIDERYIEGNTFDNMKDKNVLIGKSAVDENGKSNGDVKFGYLSNVYSTKDNREYLNDLESQIYTFSNTPNYSDDSLGNKSGEALKYKLNAINETSMDKQTQFKICASLRYTYYINMLKNVGEIKNDVDTEGLNFKFTLNKPENIIDDVVKLKELGLKLSNQTLVELTGSLNWETIKKQLEEENETIFNTKD